MNLIQKREYNKELAKSFDDRFDVGHDGLHLIEITASAKSWWQNISTKRIFLNKDSLTARVNLKEFFTHLIG